MRYVSRVHSFVAASLLTLSFALPPVASAQDIDPVVSSFRAAVLGDVDIPGVVLLRRATQIPEVGEPRRPAALLPLYASLGVLQALDVHSTTRGIAAGGRESNPVMQPIVSNRAAFIGVKAATTVGVVWASERLWRKQNRKAAIVLTALTNAGLAAVVAHNYRVAK